MPWDTIGNVPIDAPTIKSELQSWETDVAPSSVDEWEITKMGPNRCVITLQYTA